METKEKKQLVDHIKKATNILVTVGVNPDVDALSALLGLSLLLGKTDKHATAVFSGAIPPAISFLEPDKTFESTVDGLRDFIIALNKDKADHLRYKLDGDVVKIFITPYKNTIIRDTDLEFSQGDFNVELVLALGVQDKADLDSAVSAHGRILHDSTTITMTAGSSRSELGEIDWHADNASSLCEMIASLSRDLGDGLMDEHIATALLTGIVSNTERFSNNLTTSDVMKTAASLMAAGANQQLIAARLEPEEAPAPQPIREEAAPAPVEEEDDGATVGRDGSMQINHQRDEEAPEDDTPPENHNNLNLSHGPSLAEVERDKEEVLQDELDRVVPKATLDLDDIVDAARQHDHEALPKIVPLGDSHHFMAKAAGYDELEEPSMGGTLNATTEQAEEDSRAAIEDDRNRVILSHDAAPAQMPDEEEPAAEPQPEPEQEPIEEPEAEPEPILPPLPEPVVPPVHKYEAPVDEKPAPAPKPKAAPAPTPLPEPVRETVHPEDEALADLGFSAGSHPTLADLDKKTGHIAPPPLPEPEFERPPVLPPLPNPSSAKPPLEVDDARAAVASALDSAFSQPSPAANIGTAPLGEEIHEAPTAVLPPLPSLPPVPTQTAPVVAPTPIAAPTVSPTSPTGISLPPLPPLPPLPGQDGGLPPLPPLPDMSELDTHEDSHGSASAAPASQEPSSDDWQAHTVEPPSNDPGQFRIPGQH